MLKKLTLIAISATSVFAMSSAEINLNDKDLEVSAVVDLGSSSNSVEPNTTFVNFKYLGASVDNSDLADGSDISDYYEAGFLMKRKVEGSNATVGLGIKANLISDDDNTFSSMPLGIELGYITPTNVPVEIALKAYYAPDSLAFSSADSYQEFRFDANVEIIKNGSIVAGYRDLKTNYMISDTKVSVNYNKSAYVGLRFNF